MKRLVLLAAATAVCANASAAELLDFDRDPAAMFYLSKPFGGTTRSADLASYGFRMDYNAPLLNGAGTRWVRPSLFDVRFQQGQVQRVSLNGLPMGLRDPQTQRFDWNFSEHSSGYIFAGVVGVAGLLCVTETWICDDDSAAPAPVDGGDGDGGDGGDGGPGGNPDTGGGNPN